MREILADGNGFSDSPLPHSPLTYSQPPIPFHPSDHQGVSSPDFSAPFSGSGGGGGVCDVCSDDGGDDPTSIAGPAGRRVFVGVGFSTTFILSFYVCPRRSPPLAKITIRVRWKPIVTILAKFKAVCTLYFSSVPTKHRDFGNHYYKSHIKK